MGNAGPDGLLERPPVYLLHYQADRRHPGVRVLDSLLRLVNEWHPVQARDRFLQRRGFVIEVVSDRRFADVLEWCSGRE